MHIGGRIFEILVVRNISEEGLECTLKTGKIIRRDILQDAPSNYLSH